MSRNRITDENMLRMYLEADMREVLEKVGEDILRIMQGHMDDLIYNKSPQNKYYAYNTKKATGDFRASWNKNVTNLSSNGVLDLAVYSAPESMRLDNDSSLGLGVHGSSWANQSSEYLDVRDFLADIINEGFSTATGYSMEARPFFDKTISQLNSGGYIWSLIKKEMKERGLDVR